MNLHLCLNLSRHRLTQMSSRSIIGPAGLTYECPYCRRMSESDLKLNETLTHPFVVICPSCDRKWVISAHDVVIYGRGVSIANGFPPEREVKRGIVPMKGACNRCKTVTDVQSEENGEVPIGASCLQCNELLVLSYIFEHGKRFHVDYGPTHGDDKPTLCQGVMYKCPQCFCTLALDLNQGVVIEFPFDALCVRCGWQWIIVRNTNLDLRMKGERIDLRQERQVPPPNVARAVLCPACLTWKVINTKGQLPLRLQCERCTSLMTLRYEIFSDSHLRLTHE